MQYYEDMRTKFGFADGGAVPNGVEDVRELYITVINKYAEEFGSAFRACAFDRPGMHNWCLILFVPVSEVADGTDLTVNQEALYVPMVEHGDEALDNAIDEALNANLNNYVRTEVSVDWEGWEEQVYGQE
jgi:hypothetical protein